MTSPDAPCRRILFAPVSSVLAHVGRSVVLARELKSRGHDVHFAGGPWYLSDPAVVAPGEFKIHPLPDFDPVESLEYTRRIFKRPAKPVLAEHVRSELDLLDRLRPDLVVDDFRLTMFISARVRKIPVISLLGGRWLHQYRIKPFKGPRTHFFYPLLKRVAGERVATSLGNRLMRFFMRRKIRPYCELSRDYGLVPQRDLWEFFLGEDNLILDSSLVGPSAPPADRFCRVGPLAWTPTFPAPEWLNSLDRAKPVIHITMGSTGHPNLFRRILDVLKDEDYTLIISTGGQVELSEASLPRNCRVARFLPGEDIMAMSDVVIFHGGAGTGYQMIRQGVPSIIIATHLEQEFLGEVLEDHGAGIFFSMNQVLRRPSLVRRAVADLLRNAPQYREKLKPFRDELSNYQPARAAADRIETFLSLRAQAAPAQVSR